jgi:hypothetical protein
MFDARAFASWPLILLGATVFGGLFAVLGLLVEVVFGGAATATRAVLGLGGGAFLGYLAVAAALRYEDRDRAA